MTAGIESPRAGGFISSEAAGTLSRDQVGIIPVGDGLTTYPAGTVLGQQSVGTKASFANVAGNTGNGTAGVITLGPGALQGTYTGQCIAAGTTAKFLMEAPNGVTLLELTVGTAYNQGGISFTVTTGGTAYAVGDQITVSVGTAVFANGVSDTGNGSCSTIVTTPGVKAGVYTFTATSAVNFTAIDPTGAALPALTVGTPYSSGGLAFTVTAGGTAYVVGDTFTITVSAGNGNWGPVSAAAGDGTENAKAILVYPTYVGGTAVPQAAVISRLSEVKAGLLQWPTGATNDQILSWTAQLAATFIVARNSLV